MNHAKQLPTPFSLQEVISKILCVEHQICNLTLLHCADVQMLIQGSSRK